MTEVTDNKEVEKLLSENKIEDSENCYLLLQNDLNEMGLEKVKQDSGYIVNYETNEIIYVKGFENKDKTYYKLSEMKDLKVDEEVAEQEK